MNDFWLSGAVFFPGSAASWFIPGIAIVESKPAEYIRYHHQIIAAVEDCTRLCEHSNHTPSLFQTVTDAMASIDTDKQRRLDETIDKLRARYGRKVVYFGNVQDSRESAPMQISFTHIPDLTLEQD